MRGPDVFWTGQNSSKQTYETKIECVEGDPKRLPKWLLNTPSVACDAVLVGIGQHTKGEVDGIVGVHTFAKSF